MNLIEEPRPAGQRDVYRFFRTDDGQRWKVMLTWPATVRRRPDTDVAEPDFTVALSASPVDADGHALLDENGKPLVTDTHPHTFSEYEMSLPGFDLDRRLREFTVERIRAGQAARAAKTAAQRFDTAWKGAGKIMPDPAPAPAPVPKPPAP